MKGVSALFMNDYFSLIDFHLPFNDFVAGVLNHLMVVPSQLY